MPTDFFMAPIWLTVNLLGFFAAWKGARRLFPEDGLSELLCHVLVFFWAAVVGVGTFLGIVGWLSGPAMLIGVSAVSLAGLVVIRRAPAVDFGPVIRPGGWEALWLIPWAALLGFWLVRVLTGGLLKFQNGWDSLAYHFALVDHWLQEGSLHVLEAGKWYSPGNSELLGLWMVGPFSGDFLISLNNLPATLLLAAAGLSLGRLLGLSNALAKLAGMALVGHIFVLSQLVDGENDVASAALFLAVLFYIFRHLKERAPRDLWLAAVSLGLLTGIKYYTPGYAGLALVTWTFFTFVGWGSGPAGKVFLAGMAGTLALGGYWYVRNFLGGGTPLYPRDFLRHPDDLSLIYPDIGYTSFFGNGRPDRFGKFLAGIWDNTGPILFAGFVLLPVTLGWLGASGCWLYSGGQDKKQGPERLGLVVLLAGSGLLLGLTPFSVESIPNTLNQINWAILRYGLCFLSLAALGSFLLVQDFFCLIEKSQRWKEPGVALGVLFGLAVGGAVLFQLHYAAKKMNMDWGHDWLLAGNLVLVGMNLVLVFGIWPQLRLALGLVIFAALLPASAWGAHYLAGRWHRGYDEHYDGFMNTSAFSWLRENAPEGTKICALEHRYYPFFGSKRQHRVCQPVRIPSAEQFMDYLEEHRAAFVAFVSGADGPGWFQFQTFEDCPERFPKRFRLVDTTGTMQLFEVVP